MAVVVVGVTLGHAYNKYQNEAERDLQLLAYVFAFGEFVLTNVTTIICKTFVCEEIEGDGSVLFEQPTLSCESGPVRDMWTSYAMLMIIVYPVGGERTLAVARRDRSPNDWFRPQFPSSFSSCCFCREARSCV